MNDTQLGNLIEFLVGLRTKLNEIWKGNYDVDITLGNSASGDYYKVHAEITVPRNKDVRKPAS